MSRVKRINKRIWFSIMAVLMLVLTACTCLLFKPSSGLNTETLKYLQYYDSKPYNPLNLDKLIDAGYYQVIDKSCEDKGIKLTVDCIIGDSKNFYIGYTLENKNGFTSKQTNIAAAVLDSNGRNLIEGAMSAAFSPVYDGNKQYVFINVSKMGEDDFMFPSEITVSCDRVQYTGINMEPEIIKGNWMVSFKVTNVIIKEKPKSNILNSQAQLSGTWIDLKSLKEYATYTELTFESGNSDLKTVHNYSFNLEDDKGNSYMRIYSRPPLSDSNQIKLYFNRSGLEKSSKLYLSGWDGRDKFRVKIQ